MQPLQELALIIPPVAIAAETPHIAILDANGAAHSLVKVSSCNPMNRCPIY